MTTVGIIDYGQGGFHAIAKALHSMATGEQIRVSSDPLELARMDKLVLPGVGAIDYAMDALQANSLDTMLQDVLGTRPIMGICLGLHMLMSVSEEAGRTRCFNVFPGRITHLRHALPKTGQPGCKLPHIGWNQVKQHRAHPLWKDIAPDSWFYFLHSYHAQPEQARNIAATTRYCDHEFAAALLHENTFAVQFHPEKSQSVGLQLLANFLDWDGQA